jgi:hypothetical protein
LSPLRQIGGMPPNWLIGSRPFASHAPSLVRTTLQGREARRRGSSSSTEVVALVPCGRVLFLRPRQEDGLTGDKRRTHQGEL